MQLAISREETTDAIVGALAAESSCLPSHFLDGKVRIVTRGPDRAENSARRRFEIVDPSLSILTLGTGGVVPASAEWQPWVEELFRGVDRDGLFDPARLGEVARRVEPVGTLVFGPIPRFVASSEDIRSVDAPPSYSVEVTEPGASNPQSLRSARCFLTLSAAEKSPRGRPC